MAEAERARISRAARPDPEIARSPVNASWLGRVASFPSIAKGLYAFVIPQTVTGPEAEGGAPTYEDTGAPGQYVYNVGPARLLVDDKVIVKYQESRWTTERATNGAVAGGTIGTIPNCFCTNIPRVLNMTSADQNCNYKMFQSCTISYGPHPGFEPLSFGKNYYLSDQGFPDPIANGAIFYYALLCQFNQFSLTRAYLTSPYGSPFRDGVLYTWLVGGYGNTCDPFHLDNGTAFPGSDPTCVVTIDGA